MVPLVFVSSRHIFPAPFPTRRSWRRSSATQAAPRRSSGHGEGASADLRSGHRKSANPHPSLSFSESWDVFVAGSTYNRIRHLWQKSAHMSSLAGKSLVHLAMTSCRSHMWWPWGATWCNINLVVRLDTWDELWKERKDILEANQPRAQFAVQFVRYFLNLSTSSWHILRQNNFSCGQRSHMKHHESTLKPLRNAKQLVLRSKHLDNWGEETLFDPSQFANLPITSRATSHYFVDLSVFWMLLMRIWRIDSHWCTLVPCVS